MFDGAYQNGWGGAGTTSFGGEMVINATTTGDWGWTQSSADAAKDVSATSYFEYEVYFESGGGNEIDWHFVSPEGFEWDATYKFRTDASIDGTPRTLPYNVSFDTWHAVSFDMSAKSWWAADSDIIRYIKWQWQYASTAYIRNVKFVSD